MRHSGGTLENRYKLLTHELPVKIEKNRSKKTLSKTECYIEGLIGIDMQTIGSVKRWDHLTDKGDLRMKNLMLLVLSLLAILAVSLPSAFG